MLPVSKSIFRLSTRCFSPTLKSSSVMGLRSIRSISNKSSLGQLQFTPRIASHSKLCQHLLNSSRSYSTSKAQTQQKTNASKKKSSSIVQKITRATTFLFSSSLVIGASGIALLVIYLILSELFLPSGDTRTFNKAVKLVEKDPVAQSLLNFQPGERLKAYGETPESNKWTRNRPISSVRTTGKDGKDHLLMKFHVQSDSNQHGTVLLEQIDDSFWSSEFAYIALDVRGEKRHYIIAPKFAKKNILPSTGLSSTNGFLGVKWGPKKDDE